MKLLDKMFLATEQKARKENPFPPGTDFVRISPKRLRARGWTLSQTTQIVVLVLGIIAFAYFTRPFVLPVMLAWVASMALKPPVSWLRSHHLPTPLAAGIVVGIVIVATACAILYLGQPAAKWIESSPKAVSQLKQKYESVFRRVANLNAAASGMGMVTTNQVVQIDPPPTSAPEISNSQILSAVFNRTGSALTGIAEATALLILLLASGDLFMQKLVRVMPTQHDKKRAVEMAQEIQYSISRYLFSVGLINLALGIIVGTALYFLGIPNAPMWGAVAAVVNFIPYFGPALGIIAVVLAGLLTFNTAGRELAPAVAYLTAHLIEANLITPCVLGRRFALNPVIIFVFLIFCVWLWGVIGAFLAVPILVSIKVICDHVGKVSALGEFLSR